MRGRLAVATLLLTAFASGALAQSLAEAAAKERERRERERKKAGTAAKVVTDEQLGKTGGSLALDGSTGDAAPARTAKRRSEDEQPGDPEEWADLSRSEREERRRERARTQTGVGASEEQRADQEAVWRDRARRASERAKDAQAAIDRLKAEKEKALGDSLRSTDTNEILRLRSRATELDDEIRQAEGELKDALDGQRELEDEARQAGIPPGWIREG